MKRMVISTLAGAVLCGLTYFILTNSHSDMFPCNRYERPSSPLASRLPPTRRSTTCSLMAVQQDRFGVRSELTDAGIALAVLVHLLAFGLGAGGCAMIMKRRSGTSPMS